MSYLVLYSVSMLLATSKCQKKPQIYDHQNHEEMMNNCTGKNYTDYCNEIGVCQPGTHIMCMYYKSGQRSGPSCRNGRMIKLDNAIKNIIMESINTIRTGISSVPIRGKNDELLPKPRTGLAKLEWDSDLALFAQVWANQCEMLAEDNCRATQNFSNPGQVVAVTAYVMDEEGEGEPSDTMCIKRSDLNRAIEFFFSTWLQDVKYVTSEDIQKYEIIEIDGEYRRNNFLTLVNDRTTHVGCGLSAYEGYEFTSKEYKKEYIELVCNLSSQPIEDEPVYDYELVTTTETTTNEETLDKSAEVTTYNPNEETTENLAKVTTDNPNKETTDKSAEVTTDITNKETSDKSAEVTTDNPNKETSDKSAEVTTDNKNQETTDKSAEATTDNTNQETTDQSAEVITDNTNKETTDKSAEVTTDNTNQETTDKSAEVTTDNTNKETSDQSAEVTTDNTNQETTDKSAEVTTDNTNKETTDKSAEVTTDNTNHETTDKSAEVTTDNTNQETTDQSAEVTTDNTNKETTDKSAEVTTDNTNQETTDKSAEVTTDNTNKETSDKSAEVTTDNTNKETSDKSAEVTTDNTKQETTDKSAEVTTDNTNKETTDKSAEVTTDNTNQETTDKSAEVTTDNLNEETTEQPTSLLTTSPTGPPEHTTSQSSHAPKNGDNSSSEEVYQEGYGNGSGQRPTVLILPIITVEDAPSDKYLQKLSLINENLRGYSKNVSSSKNILHPMNKLAIQKPRTSKKGHSKKVSASKNLLHNMNKQAIQNPRTSKKGYSKKGFSFKNLPHTMNEQAIEKHRTSKKGSIFTRVPTFHLPSQNNDSRRKDKFQENVLLRHKLKALLEKVPKKDLSRLEEAFKLLKRKQGRRVNQLTNISPLLNLNVYNEVNLTNTEVPKIQNVDIRLNYNAPLRKINETGDDLLSVTKGVLKITDHGKETRLIYDDKTKYPENKYWSGQNKVPDYSTRNADKNDKWTVNTVFGNIKDRNRAVEIQSQFNSIPTMRKQIPIVHAKENNVADEKYSKLHNQGYLNLGRNDKSINNYIKDTNVQEQTGKFADGSKIILDDSKSKRRMYLENKIYKLKRKLQHLRQYIRRNDVSENDRFRPIVEPHNRRKNIKLKDVENFYMPDRAHSLHEF